MRSGLAALISAIIVILILLHSNITGLTRFIPRMASFPPQQHFTDPHPSSSSLSLSIAEKLPSTSPPTILVTATNLHQSTSLTVLTWDSPFDDKTLLLGVFRISDASTNEPVSTPNLRISRKLPPPEEAYMEIAPRQAITKEIVLSEPAVKLEQGTEYEIQAAGTWKVIWHASVLDVGEQNLKKMGGGTGVNSWDFLSNVIKIKT